MVNDVKIYLEIVNACVQIMYNARLRREDRRMDDADLAVSQ